MKLHIIATTAIFSLSASNYHEQAQQWAQDFVKDIDQKTAHHSLNILYWSYKRSYQTVITQQAWLEYAMLLQEMGHAICATRRNPSKQSSFHSDIETLTTSYQKVIALYQEYQLTNQHYAQLIEEILHSNERFDVYHHQAIKKLRKTARTIIAHALIEHIEQLQDQFKQTKQHMNNSCNKLDALSFFQTTRSIVSYLWNYFPTLMVRSFVIFDDQFTNALRNCSQAIHYSYSFGNKLWHVIEYERISYYKTYYTALYNNLKNKNYTLENWTLLLPDNNKSLELLPMPDKLVIIDKK
ncbi:MAG: hypothetical protein M1114_01955 [Candidatus Dependentiae bacterium]|nr:hypothetical protein [Candidatus Dependentiae bacterium]